jgi:hypothetical protein
LNKIKSSDKNSNESNLVPLVSLTLEKIIENEKHVFLNDDKENNKPEEFPPHQVFIEEEKIKTDSEHIEVFNLLNKILLIMFKIFFE